MSRATNHPEITMIASAEKRMTTTGDKVPWLTSCRLTLAIVTFLGSMCSYTMMTNTAVALICMTEESNMTEESEKKSLYSPFVFSQGNLFNAYNPFSTQGEFNWSRDTQGWILSSFYIGYLGTQFLTGFLSNIFGARKIIGTGMITMTALTLLTPIAAKGHVALFIAVQTLKGCSAGFYFPSLYQLSGRWFPKEERGFLISLALSGAPVGSVISSLGSGYLCASSFMGGWPSIFYVFGIISAGWCVIWFLMAYSSPEEHPRITAAELKHIQASLCSTTDTKSLSVPWKELLMTPAVHAVFVCTACFSWCWYVALTCLPQYLYDVLKLDIQQNGLFNSLPYLANAILGVSASLFASAITRRNLMSLTRTRKLCETISTVPSVAIIICIAFMSADEATLSVILLALWVGLMGFSNSGVFCAGVDIAPKYSGVIMGIDASLNTVPGILAPIIISELTPTGSPEEWRTVFFISAGIFLFGWLVFMIFGTADQQSWAMGEEKPRTSENIGCDNKAFDGNAEGIQEEITKIQVVIIAKNVQNEDQNNKAELEKEEGGTPNFISCYL